MIVGDRVCTKCGVARPITEFYACGPKNQNRRRTCIACLLTQQRLWYLAHPEIRRTLVASWYQRNPGARAAHRAIHNAVQRGEIVPPSQCVRCQKEVRVQAHHRDYALPFAVEWLCSKCHRREHVAPAV